MTERPGPIDGFYSVIPAGGIGSRLWPLSRADAPKFLHDLTGSGQTLLRDTWDRLAPLSGTDRIMVVTGRAHRAAVEQQLPELTDPNVVLESEPRDSSAAIGLAAAILRNREPDVIDRLVRGRPRHPRPAGLPSRGRARRSPRRRPATSRPSASRPPSRRSASATSSAATASRWMARPAPSPSTRSSRSPSLATAEGYLAAGNYLWNGGMFIARADVLLEQLGRARPDLLAGIEELAEAWETRPPAARSSTASGRRSRRSRSTTRSPSRPRPRGDSSSSPATSTGTTSATSPRSPSCTGARATSRSSARTRACSPTPRRGVVVSQSGRADLAHRRHRHRRGRHPGCPARHDDRERPAGEGRRRRPASSPAAATCSEPAQSRNRNEGRPARPRLRAAPSADR